MYKKHISLFLLTSLVLSVSISATPTPHVTGDGAVLIEARTGQVLYAKNASYKFYPASTTKVLTTLLLAESFDAAATLTKTQESVNAVPSDSSHIGLLVGDTYRYDDGLHAIMMRSDNFVSHDMAVYASGSIAAFAELMNARARAIGAYDTHFVNPHGYHDPSHYTTPFDLAKITQEAFDNPLVEAISGTPTYNFAFSRDGSAHTLALSHTAPFFASGSPYYNAAIVAAKTGYHTPAGRTLVAKAEKGDMELIAVVMHATAPAYFEDINTLINYGLTNFDVTQNESGHYTLHNHSYSPQAASTIHYALEQGYYKEMAINYMDPISTNDVLTLLTHRFGLSNVQVPTISRPPTLSSVQGIYERLAAHYGYSLPDAFIHDTLLIAGYNYPLVISTETALILQEQFIYYLLGSTNLSLVASMLR